MGPPLREDIGFATISDEKRRWRKLTWIRAQRVHRAGSVNTVRHPVTNLTKASCDCAILTIPAKTELAGKSFYLFGLANSGLAVSSAAGDSTLYVTQHGRHVRR